MKLAVFLLVSFFNENFAELIERFRWEEFNFAPISSNVRINGSNTHKNQIFGFRIWKDKLFLIIDTHISGNGSESIPVLNYVHLHSAENSPTLNPIPEDSPYQIKSGDHLDIDECNRLWILDHENAQLIIVDLTRMTIVKEEKIVVNGEIIPTHGIIVDVNATTCDYAYVYLPAFLKFGFVVYSLSEGRFWMLYHPRSSSIKIAGTLAQPNQRVYVQDMFTTNLYTAQTRNLKEGKYFPDGECERFYSIGGGRRELDTLTDIIYFDKRSGILFYYAHAPQVVSRIGCWNTNKFPEEYSKNTTSEITIREIMVSEEYVVDMIVDDSSNLWIIRKEIVSADSWERTSVSFVAYSIKVEELVKGTICA